MAISRKGPVNILTDNYRRNLQIANIRVHRQRCWTTANAVLSIKRPNHTITFLLRFYYYHHYCYFYCNYFCYCTFIAMEVLLVLCCNNIGFSKFWSETFRPFCIILICYKMHKVQYTAIIKVSKPEIINSIITIIIVLITKIIITITFEGNSIKMH